MYAFLGCARQDADIEVRTSMNHDKADGSERRLELYLMENFKHAFDMERSATPELSHIGV